MTKEDVQKIFNCHDVINFPNGSWINVEKFLDIFSEAPDNPTKEDLLKINDGKMGYKELIESGDYS